MIKVRFGRPVNASWSVWCRNSSVFARTSPSADPLPLWKVISPCRTTTPKSLWPANARASSMTGSNATSIQPTNASRRASTLADTPPPG